jgi:uncharacterized protein
MLFLLSILFTTQIYLATQRPKPQHLPITAQFQIRHQTIHLEVAKTLSQQQKGLMYRRHLPEDRGMLFEFDRAEPRSFWLKETWLPLDIIFLHQGNIVKIVTAYPCTTQTCAPQYSDRPINQVIELNAGRARELGLQPSDRLSIIKK